MTGIMANVKCSQCGAYYDPKNRHRCGALGGKEDLGYFKEAQETGTDGDL